MQRTRASLTLGLAAFLVSCPSLAASVLDKDSVLIYSDVCFHPDTGDLIGDRIVVLRFPDGDYVNFQTAEGVMSPPQVAKALISSNDSSIAFKVSTPDNSSATFKGKLAEEALTGTFNNGWQSRSGSGLFKLPLVRNRQMQFPTCQ